MELKLNQKLMKTSAGSRNVKVDNIFGRIWLNLNVVFESATVCVPVVSMDQEMRKYMHLNSTSFIIRMFFLLQHVNNMSMLLITYMNHKFITTVAGKMSKEKRKI